MTTAARCGPIDLLFIAVQPRDHLNQLNERSECTQRQPGPAGSVYGLSRNACGSAGHSIARRSHFALANDAGALV